MGVSTPSACTEAGVEVSLVHYESMMHGFVSMADLLDDGQVALTAAGEALAARGPRLTTRIACARARTLTGSTAARH